MNPDSRGGSVASAGLERPPPAIPDHEMLRRIGGGSYGEVWLARNTTGELRAVKLVRRADFSDDRPYDREFEGVKRFEPISREHAGLVDVLQIGRDTSAGFFYYVMELADDARQPEETRAPQGENERRVEGIDFHREINPETYTPKTLRSVLRTDVDLPNSRRDCWSRLSARRCMDIGSNLASALGYLHKHGRVHRDIKPSNIIFVNGLPKLADIGLVAGVDEERSFVGTEGYVAPEGPGRQSDIYALGKVLYEMLTGFSAKDFWKLPSDWATAPDHAELNELRQIALRACQPNLKWRYRTAEEMYSDLELLKSGGSLLLRKLQHTVQRMRWILVGMAMAVALVSSIVGLWFFKSRAAEEHRQRELKEIQVSRTRFRQAGWFTDNWSRLERFATVRKDQAVLEQASAMLAGLDARPVNRGDW